MRLLLDENLDWRLRRDLPEHQVESVPLIGWAGIENGELLRKTVEAGFDVLVTMDSNMVHQQSLAKYPIPVVALRAVSNRAAPLSNVEVRKRGLRYLARHAKKIGPWGRLINVKKGKR